MSQVTRSTPRSWEHQIKGFNFVRRLWDLGRPSALLFVAMGGGKSRMALDLAASLDPSRILIVCPMRVVAVWEAQCQRHATFPYRFIGLDDRAGSVAAKARLARDTLALARAEKQTAILAINYESACLEPFASLALNSMWPLVIADEIHRIKNPSGKQSRFMGRLAMRASHRLGLSGTPLPHDLLDAWAQFRFLNPAVFDATFNSYKHRYAEWGGFHDKQVKRWREIEDFNRRFYSITYRVTKEEALPDLPPELDQPLYCDLGEAATKAYRELEEQFLTWLGNAPEELLTVANALVLLTRLQQLTGGTLRDDNKVEHHIDSAKENLLADWLGDLPEDEPVVVFARFISDLDAIRRACVKAGCGHVEVSGRSPHGITQWQAGQAQVLACQIQVGGEGQDFTRARYCVFYSFGFSLAQYMQARARVHRPGQTRPTFYYHLLARHTIDGRILRAVENRAEMVETILQEMSPCRKTTNSLPPS